ncbi:hypothetical protein BOTBODRAFT_116673 [Botryobasidium botryosum FD-172 SS1]|uniref:YCII-related domain-containing protein n=1 Tax=Botryobasidium botryosum (strain FD-172 SS1) TaxID=930990 RepID=A0A067MD47_BOTB1|nr:hypothetical protein BOTBODRAFT_116673 [Botryobasidium botryosum FD-172 SS1]
MSSTATPTKHTFIIWAPDCTDAEAFSRRMSVREEHLAGVKADIAKGEHWDLKIGGAILTPESILPDAQKKMIGSAFIVAAEDIESLRKRIESDVYYTARVWDPEKLVILPFAAALGSAKV